MASECAITVGKAYDEALFTVVVYFVRLPIDPSIQRCIDEWLEIFIDLSSIFGMPSLGIVKKKRTCSTLSSKGRRCKRETYFSTKTVAEYYRKFRWFNKFYVSKEYLILTVERRKACEFFRTKSCCGAIGWDHKTW
ncbi:unnamed protein product [Cylicocyclus nassatus]|uniref:Uncharacterized protein n=1 Tax=Cylicocyclus nassatus TaxID=53992 RepID=A0AA36DPN2_CYLNA|nr:unnamed protein product [Cylicocyclus nassatus]